MFPQQELTHLARHKQRLRARIAEERAACCAAVRSVTRPLRWIDRLHARWRGLSPLLRAAAMPAAVLLPWKLLPRKTPLRGWLRWAPIAWRLTGRILRK
ncbi:MAG TPA: hypothetical protein VFB27_06010 [Opitutaceae bacterium]|nr:hypothetical protein [Opitutaceae bacterium]